RFDVEVRIDAVALEHREADFLERLHQLLGEIAALALVPVQKAPDVDVLDLILLVEGFGVLRVCYAVLLSLVHLIEANEILILRIDPMDFAVRHRFHLATSTIVSAEPSVRSDSYLISLGCGRS